MSASNPHATARATKNGALLLLLLALLASEALPNAIGFVAGAQPNIFLVRVILAFAPASRALMMTIALVPLWQLSSGLSGDLGRAARVAFALATAVTWARAIRRLSLWDAPIRSLPLELASIVVETTALTLVVLTVASYAKQVGAKLPAAVTAVTLVFIVLDAIKDVVLLVVDLPLAPIASIVVALLPVAFKWLATMLLFVLARTGVSSADR